MISIGTGLPNVPAYGEGMIGRYCDGGTGELGTIVTCLVWGGGLPIGALVGVVAGGRAEDGMIGRYDEGATGGLGRIGRCLA